MRNKSDGYGSRYIFREHMVSCWESEKVFVCEGKDITLY